MIVINKWNGNLYKVLNDSGNNIELERYSDSVVFTISKSEYNFSYKPYKQKTWKSFSGVFPFPPTPEFFILILSKES